MGNPSSRYFDRIVTTHFKTDFEARLSEKVVGKAGGEKGSEAY
jgi:hypothetical protein